MLTDQMTASDQTRKEKEFQENNTIRPAALFCDGVILQRGIPIPLWGKAAPSRRIVCRLGETEAVTYSGPSGAFFLKLPPHHASAGLELFFSDGVSECHVRNVAVGEVFLLAGQSNMEYDLAQIPDTVFASGRTLAVHLYALWGEGFNAEQAYATAVVLLILVTGINALSAAIASRLHS